ncbi:MAG: tetratricopeptide repeat protein [Methanolinea sp.]|nr:tetratricopeptide repeat protein [Methanolinea sp.]
MSAGHHDFSVPAREKSSHFLIPKKITTACFDHITKGHSLYPYDCHWSRMVCRMHPAFTDQRHKRSGRRIAGCHPHCPVSANPGREYGRSQYRLQAGILLPGTWHDPARHGRGHRPGHRKYNRALEIDPDYSDFWKNKALILKNLGSVEEANFW